MYAVEKMCDHELSVAVMVRAVVIGGYVRSTTGYSHYTKRWIY